VSKDRVKIYGPKVDSDGNLDKSASNSKVIKLTKINMTGAVSGTDYNNMTYSTSTFRGETVGFCAFNLTSDAASRITGYATDNSQNILPRYMVKYVQADNRYDVMDCTAGYDEVPIGEKPDDFDQNWKWKYYTRGTRDITPNNEPTRKVRYMMNINSYDSTATVDTPEWSDSTQYYVAKPGYESTKLWVTDRQLCFGACNVSYTVNDTRYENFYVLLNYRGPQQGTYAPDSSGDSGWNYQRRRLGFARWNPRDTGTKVSNYQSDTSGAYVKRAKTWARWNFPFNVESDTVDNGFCTLCSFKWDNKDFIGVCYISLSNGVASGAHVIALEDLADADASPWGTEPPDDSGYTGPTSRPNGGSGSYRDPSDEWDITGPNVGWNLGNMGGLKTFIIPQTKFGNIMSAISQKQQDENDYEGVVRRLSSGIIDCWINPYVDSATGETDVTILGEDTGEDCGVLATQQTLFSEQPTCQIKAVYDSFLDYAPFTKVWINIPFIGMKELPTDVIGGTVTLKVMQDNMTGDITTFVVLTKDGEPGDWDPDGGDGLQAYNKHIIAQYTTNAKYGVPVTQTLKNTNGLATALTAQSQLISSFANIMGIVQQGAAMNFPGMANNIGNAIYDAKMSEINMDRALQEAPYSGVQVTQVGSSGAWTTSLQPMIIVSRPIFQEASDNQLAKCCGITANLTARVGDVKGWVAFKNINTTGIKRATSSEKTAIVKLLTDGFYSAIL
jgi:hypothetical protein